MASLPESLRQRLGDHTQEYEGFVVARVPGEEAVGLTDLAWSLGYPAHVSDDRRVAGLARSFDLDAPVQRLGRWREREQEAQVVEGLFWVQFAYPLRAEWLAALEDCGGSVVVDLPQRVALVRSGSAASLAGCASLGSVLDAVEPVVTTDRAEPEIFDGAMVEVTLLPGVELEDLGDVAAFASSREEYELRWIEADDPEGIRRLFEHPLVLALEVRPEPGGGPSDERQSKQVARQWDPATGFPTGAAGSYLTWLSGRGLGTAANTGTVAFFESGIDNQSTALSHVDLAPRLLGRYQVTLFPPGPVLLPSLISDENGHGSMVASVAVGSGTNTGTQNGFRRGLGVSPHASFYGVDRWAWLANNTTCSGDQTALADTRIQTAHGWLGTQPTPATIANHSWNYSDQWAYHNLLARVYDSAPWDADCGDTATVQPMTLVVSTGNYDPHAATPPIATRYPANGKNVVSVGAVDGWNVGETPSSCPPLTVPDPYNGPFAVSEFSAYGDNSSGALPWVPDKFPSVKPGNPGEPLPRVKPDLVAPAWRADGARPSTLQCPGAAALCGTSASLFSYARGTSFAAPVVSGAASLLTKRFRGLSPSVEPRATLLKAAMVATADSLGPIDPLTGEVICTDCRPSQQYGWGLLNLDRLTATTPSRFFVNETFQLTGVGQSWPTSEQLFRPDDPELPILIALVWNDIPRQDGIHAANWALKRNLDLVVVEHQGSQYWVGNNFDENILGVDSGWSRSFGFVGGVVADTVNNVELVLIPQGGQLRLILQVLDVADGSMPLGSPALYQNQPFSLYAWNLEPCAGSC